MRAAGVFHEIKMSVSVIASTTGDSGDVEMSPRKEEEEAAIAENPLARLMAEV